MTLDATTCSRARRSRDARFDGRFFVGVLSTGIYCRPVCPAPSPREHNVRYFASAAAAAEAGLRPCLRCRPETAPFSAAWLGTERTVTRALRLIDDVAQGDDDVERLAERVGVTSRHLRRLFVAHLGASPGTVARTRRLQLAKTLVDETALPLAQVALAAGYGTVRRFNAAFQTAYGRPPSALRRTAAQDGDAGGSYTFRLRFRPPYDFAALLRFLGARAIPGVESVDAAAYRRTFEVAGQAGSLDVRLAPRQDALLVGVRVGEPAALAGVLQRLRRLFDLAADPGLVAEHLGSDVLLGPLLSARPGLRVPGAFDGFELAVRAVLGQQISVKGAATLAGRLAERFGRPLETGVPGLRRQFPDAAALAHADLAGVGLTQRRAATLNELARAVEAGLALGPTADPAETRAALLQVPGIGEWTAQYVALRALGEPDAFPASDLWLRRAAGCESERELLARAEPWRPWRAYAALHLWESLGAAAGTE